MVAALVASGALWAPPVGAQQGEVRADPADRPARQAVPEGKPLAKLEVRVRGRIPNAEKKKATIRIRRPGKPGKSAVRERIGIETRGQASLRFPKKPYGFEVRDRAGDNRNVPLLGMPADDDWILYPPYSDKSLMRNVLAYQTARRLGGYASRTRFVELWLNGRYLGVYVLMEKLKLLEDRIDLPEPAQLVEWTSWAQSVRKGVDFRLPGADVPILFDDPERADLSRKRRASVRRSLVAADRALYGPAFADPAVGWRRHLDEASAIDFVLLNELFKNHEGFLSSTYLAKGAGGPWSLGPIWDFDVSMGNYKYAPAGVVDGPMLAARNWAERLYADPAFVAAVAARWRSLRAVGLRETLLADVARTSDRLVATRAAKRNFERWPVLGEVIGPNPPEAAARTTYSSEVAALTAWLEARIVWMDANVDKLAPAP